MRYSVFEIIDYRDKSSFFFKSDKVNFIKNLGNK